MFWYIFAGLLIGFIVFLVVIIIAGLKYDYRKPILVVGSIVTIVVTIISCKGFVDRYNANMEIYKYLSSNRSSSSSGSKSNSSSSSFTNAYGTPTTKCAHSGCNNYIASSGDTNCCTIHSKKCLNCGKYIDEDATYCMSCISSHLSGSSNKGNSSSNRSGLCQFKSGGQYICNKKATNGSYCKEHYDYLNDAYNSLKDAYNSEYGK